MNYTPIMNEMTEIGQFRKIFFGRNYTVLGDFELVKEGSFDMN